MYWVIKYTAFIHNSISNFVNCYAYLISNKIKNTICHTVGTVPKYATLSEQFQNMAHCRNSSKICHTVGTVPKYATLSEQFQNQIEKSYKKR
jgi:hypothetical protein